jgi:hypothetical protein
MKIFTRSVFHALAVFHAPLCASEAVLFHPMGAMVPPFRGLKEATLTIRLPLAAVGH